MLQAMAAAVVRNRLSIRKMNAVVFDCSAAGVDIFNGSWASSNHVAWLGAESTAINPRWFVKETGRFGGGVGRLGLLCLRLLDDNWGCVRN